MTHSRKNIDINEAFLKYLKGDFSEDEQYDFERQLTTDPFESDAFDGLSKISSHELEKDLKKLNSRLNHRTSSFKKRVWLASAASLLILTGIVSLLVLFMPTANNMKIAINTESIASEPKPSEPEKFGFLPIEADNESETAKDEAKESASIIPKNAKPIAEPVPVVAESSDLIDNAEEVLILEFSLDNGIADYDVVEGIKTIEMTPQTSVSEKNRILIEEEDISKHLEGKSAGLAVDSRNARKIMNRNEELAAISAVDAVVLRGYVKDETNTPLAGASIVQKNRRSGVVTDKDGYFELRVNAKEADDAVFTASFIGCEPKQFDMNDNNEAIMLEPSLLALDEVVVTSVGETANEASTGYKAPAPTIGMAKYKKDVAEKLKNLYLSDANEYKITAVITVLSTGIVHKVEITKAPSKKNEEQIKNVFSETSSWYPAKRDGAFVDDEIKITIKVKL